MWLFFTLYSLADIITQRGWIHRESSFLHTEDPKFRRKGATQQEGIHRKSIKNAKPFSPVLSSILTETFPWVTQQKACCDVLKESESTAKIVIGSRRPNHFRVPKSKRFTDSKYCVFHYSQITNCITQQPGLT